MVAAKLHYMSKKGSFAALYPLSAVALFAVAFDLLVAEA